MFIKKIVKTERKTNKRYNYYRLCKSYRVGDKTRHRTILTLGRLDNLAKDDHKLLADCIESQINGDLFPGQYPDHILTLAKQFYLKLTESQKVTTSKPKKPQPSSSYYEEVDINSFEHEDVREVGAEWLCKQALEQLGLRDFLISQGWQEKEINLSLAHLVSRAVYPASEYKTAQWMRDNSSVLELFDINTTKINHKHLYKASRALFSIKEELEEFLSKKTNELIDIKDKIILYDLTNTYFEGRKTESNMAKYGKSKEKRDDAKLIVLAVVTNTEGFVKYTRICPGNLSDPKSLQQTIEDIKSQTTQATTNPLIVLDAGISTEKNLAMLRKNHYSYLCVARGKPKEKIDETSLTQLQDNQGNPIEVGQVENPGDGDRYLYVKSQQKASKEASIDGRLSQRFEEEMDHVAEGIHKKRGTKKTEKVWQRIGRIKERYPKVHQYYNISLKEQNGLTLEVNYSRKPLTNKSHGVYFLRSNIKEFDTEMFWRIYNTLTEIEATFRQLKTELNIRPIFHQKDYNSMAHIFMGVLAYSLVNTIRHQLKQKNITHEWRNIIRIMNTQKLITTTMTNSKGKRIAIRKCSKPGVKCEEIYNALNYKMRPFFRKNIVLPE
jgi:transposase